jgi:hypothetical protein
MTTKGFYSIVADAQKPGHVLVRARCKADIWNLYRTYHHRYPMRRPTRDEARDYRWRTGMKRKDFARLAAALALEVTYYNFKDEVHRHKDQENKSGPYMQVWSAMLAAQRKEDQPHHWCPDLPSWMNRELDKQDQEWKEEEQWKAIGEQLKPEQTEER